MPLESQAAVRFWNHGGVGTGIGDECGFCRRLTAIFCANRFGGAAVAADFVEFEAGHMHYKN